MQLEQRPGVVAQLVAAERDLADAGVHDARLLGPELDAAALELADRLADVEGDGADLRVRHEAAGTEHAAEPADQAHHVRRGDGGVEVEPVLLRDLLDQVLGADDVGAGLLRLLGLVALGEDDHAHGLAGAVRQVDRAAHHLVGVLGIDAEADRDVDGLVELLRDLQSSAGARRPPRREYFFSRSTSLRRFVLLAAAMCSFPASLDGRQLVDDLEAHRARGTFDGAHRRLEAGGVEVGQLQLRDLAHLLLGDLADLVLVRLARALLDPAAFLRRIAAGGVLVMKVNERSL